MGKPLALAIGFAAAIILSAPYAQELFAAIGAAWPGTQFRAIAIGATVVPAAIAVLYGVVRIRNRHLARYALLTAALSIAAGYVFIGALLVTEIFHFVEYGVLGYLFRKFGYEPAPLVLAYVLGPMLENNLRKSLILSQGDFSIFINRPISSVCLILAAAALLAPLLPMLARSRQSIALDKS